MSGTIYQINIKPQTPNERGLPKSPVKTAAVSHRGVEGDFNRYREEKHSGRLDRALLIMPLETLVQLNGEGWPINPGDIGENITTQGISYNDFCNNKKYRIGEIEIKISEPCTPCGNLKLLPYVGKERWTEFKKTMDKRRGWYAQVLKEGSINVGDEIVEIK